MAQPELPSGVHIRYRQLYRRCGKEGCSRCGGDGRGHDPYWYASWWAQGRRHDRYLGKEAPAAVMALAGPVSAPLPLRPETCPEKRMPVRSAALDMPTCWSSGERGNQMHRGFPAFLPSDHEPAAVPHDTLPAPARPMARAPRTWRRQRRACEPAWNRKCI